MRVSKRGKFSVDNYGKLRLNLRITKLPAKKTHYSSAVAVTVGKAFWGMFQEFGTKRMPNPPNKGWMRRAFDNRYEESLRLLRSELAEGVTQAAKKLAGPFRKSGLRR